MIKMHKDLVLGFFKIVSHKLRTNDEININHKNQCPFCKWDIEKLSMQSSRTLTECASFKKGDCPSYSNKRCDVYRYDESFPLGKGSTFKFIYNPRAIGRYKM